MSFCQLRLLVYRITPFAVMLLIIRQCYPVFGQEAKVLPTIVSQAKPSLMPHFYPSTDKKEEELRVLVSDVVVKGVTESLQEEVYRATTIKPGKTTTRSQLQADVNAIFNTGYFSNVRAVPEDTPLGVRVTFEIEANPVFRSVRVLGSRALTQQVIDSIFKDQYNKVLNQRLLHQDIEKIRKWYEERGYYFSKLDGNSTSINQDGEVILSVNEPVINEITISGVEGEIKARSLSSIKIKKGDVLNKITIQADVDRIRDIGYFSGVEWGYQDGKLNFKTSLNPTLRNVLIKNADADSTQVVLPASLVESTFRSQYNKPANTKQVEALIDQLITWYHNNGYPLAVAGQSSILENGSVSFFVWEKGVVVEKIQVCFYEKEEDIKSKNNVGKLVGKTPTSVILKEIKLKPGDVFNPDSEEYTRHLTDELGFQVLSVPAYTPSLYQGCGEPGKEPRKFTVLLNLLDEDAAKRALNAGNKLAGKKLWQQSLMKYKEAHRLYQNSKNETGEIFTLINLGNVYSELDNYLKSIEYYQQAISASEKADSTLLKVIALSNMADLYYDKLQEYQQAFNKYNQAVSLLQKRSISENFSASSNFSSGITAYNRRYLNHVFYLTGFVSKSKKLPNFTKFAVLSGVGKAFHELGNIQQALFFLDQSSHLIEIEIANERDQDNKQYFRLIESFVKAYISDLYFEIGENHKASDYNDEAQQEFNSILNSLDPSSLKLRAELLKFSPIVQTRFSLNTGIKDINYDVLLRELFKSLGTEGQKINIISLAKQGNDYAKAGKRQQAENAYRQALIIWKEIESDTKKSKNWNDPGLLSFVGNSFAGLGQNQTALEFYQKSLKLWEQQKNLSRQAETYNLIGQVQHNLGQYASALLSFSKAHQIAKQTGISLLIAKALFGMAQVERALGNLNYSQALGRDALKQLEDRPLAPTRTLNGYYTINGSNTTLNYQELQATTLKPSEFKFYRSLTDYLAQNREIYEFYIDGLTQQYQHDHTKDSIAEAMEVSESRYSRALLTMLNQKNRTSDVRDLPLALPLSVKQIQMQLLDQQTILLNFSLGKENSHLWLVNKTGDLVYYELPKRAEIEAAAQDFYSYLTVPSLRIRPKKAAQAGLKLSQMLLPKPVLQQLGNKRLVIVADGFLQYIPFAALPISTAHENLNEPNPAEKPKTLLLLEQHEIVSLPSVSSLALLRQTVKKRSVPTRSMAIFADPIFTQTKDTSRLDPLYPQLPGTREQAEVIIQTLPKAEQAKSVQKFALDASLQNALSPAMAQYRILHFASHGILNTQYPDRSGMILSVVDKQDNLQRSLLSPADIFTTFKDRKLSAELVVLSGCRTALGSSKSFGEEVQGEGLIGLTGSFLYAGAERVVASLWSVNDEATTELMRRFYKAMFRQEKPLPAAAALREAQLSMMYDQNSRWQTPYYWSGFILQGEWR